MAKAWLRGANDAEFRLVRVRRGGNSSAIRENPDSALKQGQSTPELPSQQNADIPGQYGSRGQCLVNVFPRKLFASATLSPSRPAGDVT